MVKRYKRKGHRKGAGSKIQPKTLKMLDALLLSGKLRPSEIVVAMKNEGKPVSQSTVSRRANQITAPEPPSGALTRPSPIHKSRSVFESHHRLRYKKDRANRIEAWTIRLKQVTMISIGKRQKFYVEQLSVLADLKARKSALATKAASETNPDKEAALLNQKDSISKQIDKTEDLIEALKPII